MQFHMRITFMEMYNRHFFPSDFTKISRIPEAIHPIPKDFSCTSDSRHQILNF
jgi:hypothetical protein